MIYQQELPPVLNGAGLPLPIFLDHSERKFFATALAATSSLFERLFTLPSKLFDSLRRLSLSCCLKDSA
jgi:hypothetical protein